MQGFDMNEGMVSMTSSSPTKGSKAGAAGAAGGMVSADGSMSSSMMGGSMMSESTAAGGVAGVSGSMAGSTVGGGAAAEEFGSGALDEGMGIIKRKTIIVRSENVGEVFMQNMASITETVQGFQKMSEDSFKNDAALLFQNEKENY